MADTKPPPALDYAKELWTVGNAVAGFSLIQSVLAVEEAGKWCSPLGLAMADEWSPLCVMILEAIFLAGYLGLIGGAYRGESRIVKSASAHSNVTAIVRSAAIIRVAIVVISLVSSSVLLGLKIFQIRDGAAYNRDTLIAYARTCGLDHSEPR